MDRLFVRTICALVLFGVSSAAPAASPGVPALPATAANYVGYAVTNLPSHFSSGAVAATNNTPANNRITNAGATLGRVLFYDKRLSHNNSTSCSSCHQQQFDFSDPARFSTGFNGELTGRHSMGLSNNAYYDRGRFFWDERAATLEAQALAPIENAVEMGSTLSQVRAELAATDFYPALFQAAFGTPEITNDRIAKAIAQFERSMVSYQSKYDTAFSGSGQPNFAAVFTAQEQQGRNIFNNNCAQCHQTDAQTMGAPHNIGLDAVTTDEGAGDGEFKSPSLRNVAVRGGYMHDGRFTTLQQVVDFYSTGIQNNPDLDGRLTGFFGQPIRFNFTNTQKAALIAFLNTLTDNTFLTSSLFSDPFVDLPGDFNGDGVVDQDDLSVWETSFANNDGADADGNGASSGLDFLAWQRNFGTSWRDLTPLLAATAAVPEPTTLTLFCLGVGGMMLRRRR